MSFYGTRYSVPRKTCKVRLSRNSTKFDVLGKFRETIPMVKSVSSSRSRKFSDFYQNYDFAIFHKIRIFWGLTDITHKIKKAIVSKIHFCPEIIEVMSKYSFSS